MNEQQTLPRMRTLAKAIEEIKAEDPNTALTQNQLRVLVKSGAIPSVSAGRHTLINLDLLIAYLASDDSQRGGGRPPSTPPTYGTLRRIDE